MKIEIKDFDIRHYSALIRNSAAYRKIKNVTVFSGIMFLLVALMTVWNAVATHSADSVMITCTTVIFAMFMALGYRLRKLGPIKGFEVFKTKNPNFHSIVTFGEERIDVEGHSDVSDTNSSYDYVRVASAEEKDGFFIVLLEGSGYIVFSENEIIEGTAEEFRSLLRKKIGTKYKEK